MDVNNATEARAAAERSWACCGAHFNCVIKVHRFCFHWFLFFSFSSCFLSFFLPCSISSFFVSFFLCFTPFFDRPQLLKCSRVHLRILVGCIFPWKAAVCLGRACFLWMCPDIPKRRIICRSLDKFLNDHQWRALLLRHRRICLPWLKIRTCFFKQQQQVC